MTGATYFIRPCPTCGRSLEMRVQHLGRRVACQHCGAEFVATSHTGPTATDREVERYLHMAEEMLKRKRAQLALRPWQESIDSSDYFSTAAE